MRSLQLTSGSSQAAYLSAEAETWVAMPMVGPSVGWALVRGMRLRGDALAGWTLPAVEVRTCTTDVGPWGAPELLLSLGVEVLGSP